MRLQPDSLESLDIPGDFGIYIHVPFCERRCRYCAFVSSVIRPSDGLYARSICEEFNQRMACFKNGHLTTLYFGGGTPTMLPDRDLASILDQIFTHFSMPSEMTLEANPEHITPERAANWKSLGFTRISLGIQAFDAGMLRKLGRHHDKTQIFAAIHTLDQAGFDEISIDLIYGAHYDQASSEKEEFNCWHDELVTAKSLNPAHVSCYELTLEEHTPLCTLYQRGEHILCEEDTIIEMMHAIPDVLGMQQYEVSNYSRDGYISRHNVSCWAGVPYLGLGPGAHSLIKSDGIQRVANDGNVRAWLNQFQNTCTFPPFVLNESLSSQTHLAERLMCASRTRIPWRPQVIADHLQTSLDPFKPALEKAVKYGLLARVSDDMYRTTQRGIDLNNQLDQLIFECTDDDCI